MIADKHEDQGLATDTETEGGSSVFIDDGFARGHGTVASKSSLNDEKQIAFDPQSSGGAAERFVMGLTTTRRCLAL
jgi:hypothetical protein